MLAWGIPALLVLNAAGNQQAPGLVSALQIMTAPESVIFNPAFPEDTKKIHATEQELLKYAMRNPTAGTYFVTVDIRPIGEDDGMAFCLGLPERCGVVAVPNVVFYDDKEAGRPLVRFAFCKRLEVIDEERQAVKNYRREAAKQGFGTFGDLLRAKLGEAQSK